uniref:Uncharacterized protein n=2 Tax=Oncorhynchus kisutch TaxID=8019 RepID=A0A8C7JUX7_ONCKI
MISTDQHYHTMSQRLREMCVVFAGPLPSDYTERAVRRLFSSCGNVRAVRLLNATQRVHAEVEFELLEGAVLAVEMLNGTLLHSGHIVKVQRPVKKSTLDLDVFLSSLQDDPLNANVIYAAGLKANAKTAQFAAKVNGTGLNANAAAEVNETGLNANIAALPAKVNRARLHAKANHSGLLEKVNGTFLNAKAKLAEANGPGLHAKAKFAKLAELSVEVNGTLLQVKTMLAEIAAEANVGARLHAKTAGLCEEDLREAFGQYGTVQGVILPAKHSRKQKRRRHAFLKYDSPDTVDAVLSSPVELWDRKVSTRRALTPPHLCSWVTMTTTTGSDRETLDESSQETGREEQEVACAMRKLDRRVGKLFRSLPDNTLSIVLLPGHNRFSKVLPLTALSLLSHEQNNMNPLSSEKETLIDEIEQSLFTLTVDNLRYLCERHGKDGSEIKGMNHRLLRRKVMEEMWDNTESMKSEEQGMSWLVQLKEDIRRMLEDASGAPISPSQSDDDDAVDYDEECDKEDSDWLPSNGLKAEHLSSSRSDDDAADCDKDWDVEDKVWLASDGLEAESDPERHTPEQRNKLPTSPSALLKPPGRASPSSVLLLGLKRVSVRLVDCRKTPGQSSHIIHKTTQTGEKPHSWTNAEQHKTLSGDRPGSHICDHCGKTFTTARSLQLHLQNLKRYRDNLTGEKPHVCSTCGKGFSEAGSLKRHLRTHTGEKPYVCHHCGKAWSDSGNLRRHTRKTHPGEKVVVKSVLTGEKPYHCSSDDCGMSFVTSRKRRVHQRIHTREKLCSTPNAKQRKEPLSGDGSHICDHCGKSFITARSLKRHLQYLKRYRDNLTGEKPHVCSTCRKGFSEASSLKRHLRTHTGEKPYVCHHCGKNYNDSGNLQRHIRTHTGEKPYHCSECGRNFREKISLVHHREVVHTDHPHRCGHCMKSFVSESKLESHMQTRHPPNDPLKKPHVCSECGRGFGEAGSLKRHVRIHTGEKPYVCPRCGKDFTQSGLLQRHMRTHTGETPYHCLVCGMKFRHTISLKQHHLKNHKGETLGPVRMHQGPLPCPHCGEKFSTKALLKGHIQKTHKSRVHCPQCDKTFTTKGSLLVHQRKHTGERPYLCPQCGKSFSLTGSLKLHLRIHAGEKPYCCTYCDKSFTSKSHCILHLRIHTGEKPYQCPDCGRRFRDGNVLKNHRRTHTGEKPFQCHVCDKAFAQWSSLKKHQDTHRLTQPVSVPRLPNPYPPPNQHVPYPYPSQTQW